MMIVDEAAPAQPGPAHGAGAVLGPHAMAVLVTAVGLSLFWVGLMAAVGQWLGTAIGMETAGVAAAVLALFLTLVLAALTSGRG